MTPGKISITLTCGLIAGLAMILLTTILYLAGIDAFIGWAHWLAFVIVIVVAVVAAAMEKKAQGGFIEFKEALKSAFLVFVIGLLLQTIFAWILLNFIDPAFRNAMEKAVLDQLEKFMQRWGAHQEDIDKALEQQRGRDQYSLSSQILGLCFTYIVFFLVSLLIAAIVKKKKPEFSDTAFK